MNSNVLKGSNLFEPLVDQHYKLVSHAFTLLAPASPIPAIGELHPSFAHTTLQDLESPSA